MDILEILALVFGLGLAAVLATIAVAAIRLAIYTIKQTWIMKSAAIIDLGHNRYISKSLYSVKFKDIVAHKHVLKYKENLSKDGVFILRQFGRKPEDVGKTERGWVCFIIESEIQDLNSREYYLDPSWVTKL